MTNPSDNESGANSERSRTEPTVRTVYVTRKETHKKSRLSKGWPIMLVAAAGIVLIWWGLSGVANELSKMNGSIQEQTEAVQEQTGVLREQTTVFTGIQREIAALTEAVQTGFNRIAKEIQEAADNIMNS